MKPIINANRPPSVPSGRTPKGFQALRRLCADRGPRGQLSAREARHNAIRKQANPPRSRQSSSGAVQLPPSTDKAGKGRQYGAPESLPRASYGPSSAAQGRGTQEKRRTPVCASALAAVPEEIRRNRRGQRGQRTAGRRSSQSRTHTPSCTTRPGLALVALAGYRVLGARVGRPSCSCALSRLPKKRRVTPSARRFLFAAALWVTKETCGACLRHWIARAVLRIGVMARENAVSQDRFPD